MTNLAAIVLGAVHGSTSVVVNCLQANGTTIVLYRSTYHLGSGTITGNTCTIAVPALAEGDIIQASVTTRGNLCDEPVSVVANTAPPTGWQRAQTVVVRTSQGEETLTVEAYQERYGHLPPATYDPSARINVIAPPPDPDVVLPIPPAGILFDVRVECAVGSTTVTVQNVANQLGNPLVRWTPTGNFSNSFQRTYTQPGTVTIAVKGEGSADVVTRTVAYDVFNPPALPNPPASDILAFGYDAGYTGSGIGVATFIINSLRDCETRLEGVDNTWRSATRRKTDKLEAFYDNIPQGTVGRFWVRIAGDNDADRWKSIAFTMR